MAPMQRRSGMDLRLLRTAADVKVIELAKAMDTVPSNVSRIESSRNVTDKAWDSYMAALTTLTAHDKPAEAA